MLTDDAGQSHDLRAEGVGWSRDLSLKEQEWHGHVLVARDGIPLLIPDGIVSYTAHELRHVCAWLLIASGASDMQVARQMGHSRIETTKNIYGHLFAQDQASILDALNQAVSRLYLYESQNPQAPGGAHAVA